MPDNPEYKEQGSKLSGYEAIGPYNCGVCVHRIHKSIPICIHPTVISDPELKRNKCYTDNPATNNQGVFVNIHSGCCKYVKVEAVIDPA